MIAPLAAALEVLDRAKGNVLEQVRRMTPEQRSFRAEPDAWSPVQVLHHLLLAEESSLETMVRVAGRPSRRRTLSQRLGYLAVRLVLRIGIRVRNPVPAARPSPDATLEDIESRWETCRSRLEDFLASRDQDSLDEAGFGHPIAGPLSLEEALGFLADHLAHHRRQLARIQAHPEFPG